MAPLRDVMQRLGSHGVLYVEHEAEVYFRDVHDDVMRVIELLDTYRDILSSALDLHLSSVSNRLNRVMKQLTVVATVFMPLSFIVGPVRHQLRADAVRQLRLVLGDVRADVRVGRGHPHLDVAESVTGAGPATPLVKICGLTRPEDVALAVALGAWAVGFVLAPSPAAGHGGAGAAARGDRSRSGPAGASDAAQLGWHDRRPLTVGVFGDASPEAIVEARRFRRASTPCSCTRRSLAPCCARCPGRVGRGR